MKSFCLVVLTVVTIFLSYGTTSAWGQRPTWEEENKRLGGAQAHRYYHPAPPVGKWAAIYSADFAKKFDLPVEGIFNALSNSIEYMEAVSVPAKKLDKFNERYPDQDCVINIIAGKNHDIPLHEDYPLTKHITKMQRIEYQKIGIAERMKQIDKPLHFLEMNNKYDASYRSISALNFIHSFDVLPGYDYFSKREFRCQAFLKSIRENRDIKYNRFLRASVIEREAKKSFHTYLKNEGRTVVINKDDDSSFITIPIPRKLATLLYKGTEIPLEPRHSITGSPTEIVKGIAALPLVPFIGLTVPKADKSPHNIALPAPWPEDTPTHFKLGKTD